MAEFNWGALLSGVGAAISGPELRATTTPAPTTDSLKSYLPIIGIGLALVVGLYIVMRK